MKITIGVIFLCTIHINLFAISVSSNNYQISQISKKEIRNLTLLGQVWSFMKYHHPVNSNLDCNWDDELFQIIPEIITAKNKATAEMLLLNWVDSFGKIEVIHSDNQEEVEPFMTADTMFQYIDNEALHQKMRDIRRAKTFNPNRYIRFDSTPQFDGEIQYHEFNLVDIRYRLLAIYRYWGAVNYFYPYRYTIGQDWNLILEKILPYFIAAKTNDDYLLAIARLTASTNDTHANFNIVNSANCHWGSCCTSAIVQYIENRPTVVHFRNENEGGLKIGDVVKRINKKSVNKIKKYYFPYLSASNREGKFRNIGYNMTRTNDSTLNMTIKRDGKRMRLTVPSTEEFKLNVIATNQIKEPIRLIDSTLYIYAYSDPQQIRERLTNKKDYSKIILDMRCYPMSWDEGIMEHLGGDSVVYVRFTEIDRANFGQSIKTSAYLTGGPNQYWYDRPVVIIVNEHTQSMAEFLVMELQQFPKAYTIGSRTSGTDGDVAIINLPGGHRGCFSSVGVYYPNWGETQRVGVHIDEVIKPTLKAILEGKDELLIKALEFIYK